MRDTTVLRTTAERAIAFYEALDEAPVAAVAEYRELLDRLGGPLPDEGAEPVEVIDHLLDGAPGVWSARVVPASSDG